MRKSATKGCEQNNLASLRSVRVKVPATGGELWQGYIDGKRRLVNCPIDYFAEIRVSRHCGIEEPIVPANFELLGKVTAAVHLAERRSLGNGAVAVEVLNSVPRGLGMASSTAELAALLYGLGLSSGISEQNILAWVQQKILKWESGNDGNYHPGVNLIQPETGQVLQHFRQIPALKMLVVDTGGFVATESMNRDLEAYICKKWAQDVRSSYTKMLHGLALGDLTAIGKTATANTILYQKVMKKPKLTRVIELIDSFSLVGICSGHTGTVLGVLTRLDDPMHFIRARLESIYGDLSIIGEHTIISGGFYGETFITPTF